MRNIIIFVLIIIFFIIAINTRPSEEELLCGDSIRCWSEDL